MKLNIFAVIALCAIFGCETANPRDASDAMSPQSVENGGQSQYENPDIGVGEPAQNMSDMAVDMGSLQPADGGSRGGADGSMTADFGGSDPGGEAMPAGEGGQPSTAGIGGQMQPSGANENPCEGQADDTILDEEGFGECTYEGPCVNQGQRMRTQKICQNEQVTVLSQYEDCRRDTDGTVVTQGEFGPCLYTDECVLVGAKKQINTVCYGGQIVEKEATEICERQTDGVLVSVGQAQACEYDTHCDQIGLRTRTDLVCTAGVKHPKIVETPEGCNRAPVEGWLTCDDGICVDMNSSPNHCGACGVVCPANSTCDSGRCICVGHWTGEGCAECSPRFEGPECMECSGHFSGPNCDECEPGFIGENCDERPVLDYTVYERRAGEAFTPMPSSLPIPEDTCAAKPIQVVLQGPGPIDCTIDADTCARLPQGVDLVCEGGMTVDGLVWIQSGDAQDKTLLVTDYIEISDRGAFYVTGSSAERPYAENVEIFLRHEYCGKPEDGFDGVADADGCRRKGKLTSMGGTVKIAGLPKTSWSLLTHDTADTHQLTPRLIRVDECSGWRIGDVLSIAPTGGDQESFQGVRNWCNGPGCSARQNSQTEDRHIDALLRHEDDTCDIVLDAPLHTNHRGNLLGVATPLLRIQAEVVNRTRSVVITGGYQVNLNDPSSRVRTRYDYSNGGMQSHVYGQNREQSPCRVCKLPDDPSASDRDLCTDPQACQAYDAEGETVYLCGQDCSPIGMQGITTAQMHGGIMQISHTEVEKCGRRELAEYCLHFHHVGDVKHAVEQGERTHESYLIGNSIQEGINKGITLHGTHKALVQSNVIHNQKGPGIYLEDGNELFNIVEENVVMCSELQANSHLCKLKNARNRPETTDSDWNEVSGLYFLAPLNHTIGNRVFGYDNAMYVNRNTSGHTGLGLAKGKICTSAFPFGLTVGNVFHNNAGFGWYANTAFPMDLANLGGLELRADGERLQGTVTDWTKCMPFSAQGIDQSFNVKIQKHTEYFNDFSAGVYSVGDVTLEDYTSYGGNKGLYWKTYRRGMNSDALCVNCVFARTSIEGPGGSAHVEFKNSDFYRRHEAYQVNHHCSLDGGTGGLCASHYDFRTSRFFQWSQERQAYEEGHGFFYSGVYPHSTLIFTPDDKVLQHVTQNVAFDIAGEPRCQNSTPYAGEGWHSCDNRDVDAQAAPLELRIVRIYSPNRGALTVTNHSEGGRQYTIPWTHYGPQSGGAGAYGVLPRCAGRDCPNYMMVSGYVFSIPSDSEISLQFETVLDETDVLADLFVLEYSDPQMLPVTELTLRSVGGTGLMDSALPCTIPSTHTRSFITPFGPVSGAAGAWFNECGRNWVLNHSIQDLIDASYSGDVNPGDGGGQNGNNPPDVDVNAEPEQASPWSTRQHPSADRVFGLYTSIADYVDPLSQSDYCRGRSACAWPTWGNEDGVCTSCDITWFPGWSQHREFSFDYQLDPDSGQRPQDKILKVELGTNWFTFFELPPGQSLNLSEYDVLHFEVWSPGVTNMSIRVRDYGENQVWNAGLRTGDESHCTPENPCDIERTKAVAFDDNLIPNQWSVIEIPLDELFAPDAPRNLGQLLAVDIAPNLAGMPLYFSNLYFYKRE